MYQICGDMEKNFPTFPVQIKPITLIHFLLLQLENLWNSLIEYINLATVTQNLCLNHDRSPQWKSKHPNVSECHQ